MKYSALVPIRSTNEAYTPFSGFRRRIQHSRAQSEVPPISTSVMGIQCDLSEFIPMISEKPPESPDHSTQIPRTQACSPFTNPAISRIYENESNSILEPGFNQNSENSINSKTYKRIEFGKVGDWNDTYVLKNRNLNAHRLYDSKVNTFKGQVQKTCKVIELSPNILTGCGKRLGETSMWLFKSNDRGVFQMKGTLRLHRRLNTSNLKH